MARRANTLAATARVTLILGAAGLLFVMVMAGVASYYQGEPPGPSPLGMMIFTLLIGVPSLLLFLVGVLLAIVALARRRLAKPADKAASSADSLQ